MVNILVYKTYDELYPGYSGNEKIISTEKKNQISINKCISPKYQTMYGKALLHYGLSEIYNIKKIKLDIKFGEHGKPYLNDYGQIHYNISHSNRYVVCAIAEHEIGIDIQNSVTWNDEKFMNLAKNFFSEKEVIAMSKSKDKRGFFIKLWVLKESYLKYKGEGLRLPLDKLEFNVIGKNIAFFNKDDADVLPYFKLINISTECMMAMCMKEQDEYTLRKIKYEEISNIFRYLLLKNDFKRE